MENRLPELEPNDDAILATLSIKYPSVKTVFNLRPSTIDFMETLARRSFGTLKETLEVMARHINKKSKEDDPPLVIEEISGEKIRKSFAISEEARKVFNDLAKKYGVSRDTIVENAVILIGDYIMDRRLSPEKKIQYAKILLDGVNRMLDIFSEPDFEEALKALHDSNDEDFGDIDDPQSCGDLFGYADQINELPPALEEFIKAKEEELEDDASDNGEEELEDNASDSGEKEE